ncbi:MAG: hypothetical protein HQL86_08010, partial [Magnetococcales bacterium]|nr:hypothetical protein [Magnetococcales bacterium]
ENSALPTTPRDSDWPMNNKIGLLQRRVYGFSDMEFFKLKIMALHEATAVLIG